MGRPLLGSAATERPSLSEGLVAEYVATFGPLPAEGQQFLWFGAGLMALETTAEDLSTRTVETCESCAPSYKTDERPPVPYAALGLTLEQWISQRQASVDELLAKFVEAQANEGNVKTKGLLAVITEPAKSMGEQLDLGAPPPPPSFFCGIDEYEGNLCTETPDPDKTPTGEVPGGYGAFNYYYQTPGKWASSDPNAPDECLTGCVPIAALTLLDYYDRRGNDFLIPGVDNSSVDDPEVKAALVKLREVLKTNCKADLLHPDKLASGSTKTMYFEEIDTYIDDTAHTEVGFPIDMGWTVKREECPDPGLRYAAVKAEISQGRPVIIDYDSTWESGPQCNQNVDPEEYKVGGHAAVVYGYFDDGDDTRYEDAVLVRTGWSEENSPTKRYEPIVGTGDTGLTQVVPGCSPSQPEELCKTLIDLPDEHWGHTSAETLPVPTDLASDTARSAALAVSAAVYALARDEKAGRRPVRLLEPDLATWGRFRGQLGVRDLIALLIEGGPWGADGYPTILPSNSSSSMVSTRSSSRRSSRA